METETRADQLCRWFKNFLNFISTTLVECGIDIPQSFEQIKSVSNDILTPYVIDEIKKFPNSEDENDVIFALGSTYASRDLNGTFDDKLKIIQTWGDYLRTNSVPMQKLLVHIKFLKLLVNSSE